MTAANWVDQRWKGVAICTNKGQKHYELLGEKIQAIWRLINQYAPLQNFAGFGKKTLISSSVYSTACSVHATVESEESRMGSASHKRQEQR